MRLNDMVAAALGGMTARLRRDAIAYAICAVCALAAIVLAAWASVLALEPLVGMVYARLIIAAIFVLIAITSIVWLQLARDRPPVAIPLAAARAEPAQRQAQFAQLAMIVEAVLLGFTLSRKIDRR